MNPSKHSRSLWFTPRTPWGRLPQNRPGQNYLRASEDAPVQPGQKRPNALQRFGSGVVNAVRNARPFVGVEAEKVGSEHGSGGFLFGLQKGAEGPKSTASDEAEKEVRNRALNQRQGIYVPADEDSGQEGARQGSTNHVTTDQELRTAQKVWAQNHPEWVEQKVKGSMDKLRAFQAAQAAQARPQR